MSVRVVDLSGEILSWISRLNVIWKFMLAMNFKKDMIQFLVGF